MTAAEYLQGRLTVLQAEEQADFGSIGTRRIERRARIRELSHAVAAIRALDGDGP